MAIYAADRRASCERRAPGAVDLALNRRSQPGVIDWVNDVFAAPDRRRRTTPEVQPPTARSRRSATDDLHGPAVAWFGERSRTQPAR